MPRTNIFGDLHKAYIRQAYLRQNLRVGDITTGLNKKFSTEFTVKQVQRHISDKLSKRRKQIEAKVNAIVVKSDSAIAREHAKTLAGFAQRSAKGAEKAFDFVERSADARSLASAAGAAKTLVGLYRVCAGLEGGTDTQRAAAYNFNFISVQPQDPAAVSARQVQAVEAVVAEVEAEEIEEEDDESEVEEVGVDEHN